MRMYLHHRAPRAALALLILAAACDEDDPTMPALQPPLTASVATLELGAVDLALGAGLPGAVTIRNDGSAGVTVQTELFGPAAGEFTVGPIQSLTIPAGGSFDFRVSFDPAVAGTRSATLRLHTDAGEQKTLDVALRGEGASFRFTQVDRMGIPTLNTVFNHAPIFSKKNYNRAGPAADLATYKGQFEVVLGAVANPNPSAIAALLLPDELPVRLDGSASNFALLNGRDLADDAVDVALTVTVGVASLHSDNVDHNDRAFLPVFPYLASAH